MRRNELFLCHEADPKARMAAFAGSRLHLQGPADKVKGVRWIIPGRRTPILHFLVRICSNGKEVFINAASNAYTETVLRNKDPGQTFASN